MQSNGVEKGGAYSPHRSLGTCVCKPKEEKKVTEALAVSQSDKHSEEVRMKGLAEEFSEVYQSTSLAGNHSLLTFCGKAQTPTRGRN